MLSVQMRKTCLRRALLIVLPLQITAACSLGVASPPRSAAPPSQLQAFRQRFVADCDAGIFSGVVAIERQGRPIFMHNCGWADEARTVPISPTARFKFYSVSKAITATTILRLVEARRMELDATLATYVPTIPAPWRGITIRQLLQQTSHVPEHTEKLLQAYRVGGHRTHEAAMRQVLASLGAQESALLGQPGQGWRYSNFGYELLALAAATRENSSFHSVVRRRLFAPAAMTSASMEQPAPDPTSFRGANIPDLVTGFNGAADRRVPALSYSFVQQGAGAVVGTYRDLMAFARALTGGRLLSRRMLARNESDAVTASPTARYGYGWLIRSVGRCSYWQHDGGNNGYVSDLAIVPEKQLTVVILSNLGFTHVTEYRQVIMRSLLQGETCRGVGAS